MDGCYKHFGLNIELIGQVKNPCTVWRTICANSLPAVLFPMLKRNPTHDKKTNSILMIWCCLSCNLKSKVAVTYITSSIICIIMRIIIICVAYFCQHCTWPLVWDVGSQRNWSAPQNERVWCDDCQIGDDNQQWRELMGGDCERDVQSWEKY